MRPFEEAVKRKARKRFMWRWFAPYFLAMFKNWAHWYMQELSEEERERFRKSWLSS